MKGLEFKIPFSCRKIQFTFSIPKCIRPRKYFDEKFPGSNIFGKHTANANALINPTLTKDGVSVGTFRLQVTENSQRDFTSSNMFIRIRNIQKQGHQHRWIWGLSFSSSIGPSWPCLGLFWRLNTMHPEAPGFSTVVARWLNHLLTCSQTTYQWEGKGSLFHNIPRKIPLLLVTSH